MFKAALFSAAAISLACMPLPQLRAQGNCENCDLPPGCRGVGNQKPKPNAKDNCQRIDLTVETDIDFGRLVVVGDGVGRVFIDLSTGQKVIAGGLEDLGGMSVQGRAVITGSPNSVVRVDFPASIVMNDPAGGRAELRDFVTDLPVLAVLDGSGRLVFQFSGTMFTDTEVAIGGKLRGRVPIRVNYD